MFECLKRTELKTFDSVRKKSKCVRIAAKTKGTIFTLLVCVCVHAKCQKRQRNKAGRKMTATLNVTKPIFSTLPLFDNI